LWDDSVKALVATPIHPQHDEHEARWTQKLGDAALAQQRVADPADRVPAIARACLAALGAQLCKLKEQILEFDRLITAWHRSNEMSVRSMKRPVSVQCWPYFISFSKVGIL
jgi:hypothetical protein